MIYVRLSEAKENILNIFNAVTREGTHLKMDGWSTNYPSDQSQLYIVYLGVTSIVLAIIETIIEKIIYFSFKIRYFFFTLELSG